jgi:ABC-type bacteriocin/lantibiotic exporter with double-glycine peptidase domain
MKFLQGAAMSGLNPLLEHGPTSSTIRLDVPKLAQQKSMSCWYASVCMVRYYFEYGPRQGLPKVWQANSGISIPKFVDLAKNEGLSSATTFRGAANTYGQNELYQALYWCGPLWCAGAWFGVNHIVVLTGVKGGNVIINDPDGGVEKTKTVKWFNEKVAHAVPNHLMCADPKGIGSLFVKQI